VSHARAPAGALKSISAHLFNFGSDYLAWQLEERKTLVKWRQKRMEHLYEVVIHLTCGGLCLEDGVVIATNAVK
jgi:hypothetical protein